MPSANPLRSLAEQIADLDDPAPRDVDVDDFENGFDDASGSSDESNESINEDAGREHYQDVGKSKLRRAEMPTLGSQYAGARVSRGTMANGHTNMDAESSDEDSEGTDEDEDMVGDSASDDMESDEQRDDAESPASSASNPDQSDDETAPQPVQPKRLSETDRAKMRQMMAAEQKAVASSISQAAKDDIAKGRAVKRQRDVYTSHLNARIRLQKGLVEANSLDRVLTSDPDAKASYEALKGAEAAAVTLLRTITDLQTCLASESHRKKRSFSTAMVSSSDILDTLNSAHDDRLPHHRNVLAKWSHKTQSASIKPSHDKLGGVNTQSLISALDSQLSGPVMDRAVAQAHTPRSCAPLQVAAGIDHDVDIYDDAGFYALLLREFIEVRSATGSVPNTLDVDLASLRHANRARKKNVDTKASKGRKLRYTVHERLQNFMAPQDVGTWGARQADELFASLLGKRVRGGLGEAEEDDDDKQRSDSEGMGREMEGLRLFRSAP